MSDPYRWCPGARGITEPHDSTESQFYWRRNHGKLRIDSMCKECRKLHTKAWRQANPDKVKAYNDTYATKHREEIRTRQREFYRMVYGKGAWTWKKYRDHEVRRVDPGPFREWFEREIRPMMATKEEIREAMGETTRRGHDGMHGLVTQGTIAQSIGILPDTFGNYLNGKAKTVPSDVVDKVGMLVGNMNLTDDLYPPEAGDEAEAA